MAANQITSANAGEGFEFAGKSPVVLSPRRGVAEFCRSAASDTGCFEQEPTEGTEMESVSRFTQLPPVDLESGIKSHAHRWILFV